ncbi:hypothetical protein [Prochlorococcus marinus]|nr:hypothetical protein [Prochlorococcus marinus]
MNLQDMICKYDSSLGNIFRKEIHDNNAVYSDLKNQAKVYFKLVGSNQVTALHEIWFKAKSKASTSKLYFTGYFCRDNDFNLYYAPNHPKYNKFLADAIESKSILLARFDEGVKHAVSRIKTNFLEFYSYRGSLYRLNSKLIIKELEEEIDYLEEIETTMRFLSFPVIRLDRILETTQPSIGGKEEYDEDYEEELVPNDYYDPHNENSDGDPIHYYSDGDGDLDNYWNVAENFEEATSDLQDQYIDYLEKQTGEWKESEDEFDERQGGEDPPEIIKIGKYLSSPNLNLRKMLFSDEDYTRLISVKCDYKDSEGLVYDDLFYLYAIVEALQEIFHDSDNLLGQWFFSSINETELLRILKEEGLSGVEKKFAHLKNIHTKRTIHLSTSASEEEVPF